MIVTVVPHGGVNPAAEYGFEEAVDGSVALNPAALNSSRFRKPSAMISSRLMSMRRCLHHDRQGFI